MPTTHLHRLSASMAQPVMCQHQNLDIVGTSPIWDNAFLHVGTHFGHAVGTELSHLGYGWEGNSDTAEPSTHVPMHSPTYTHTYMAYCSCKTEVLQKLLTRDTYKKTDQSVCTWPNKLRLMISQQPNAVSIQFISYISF